MAELNVATRLAALEAKDEVRAVAARYCVAADEVTRIDDLLALFTPDAVLRNPAGSHDGIEAIGAYYRGFFADGVAFARHHTMNQVIDIPEPGIAHHRSYFLAMLGKGGESKLVFGRYDDTLVKTDRGWRFSVKVNEVTGATTLADGWAASFAAGMQAVR